MGTHYDGLKKNLYDARNIYVGIHSNYVGMKRIYNRDKEVNYWEQAGTRADFDNGITCVANCNMVNGMSFDDMRLIMYQYGEIGSYEIGKTSSQEMIDVLKYASSYYHLDQNFQK